MATVGMYVDMPLEDLRREVRAHFFPPVTEHRSWLARRKRATVCRMVTRPARFGSTAWVLGIKGIDNVIDTPAETVFGKLTREEYLQHTTRVMAAFVGRDDPSRIEAVATDLPMILAVREGWRLGRDVAPMLYDLWMSVLPDARRQLRGEVFPNECVQAGANHTNHLYGVGWVHLLGVPLDEATRAMRHLTLDAFEVDNLEDLLTDLRDSCAHYTIEQLQAAGIDPDVLAKARTWEEVFAVPNMAAWFHERAAVQVGKWSGSSRKELVQLFGLAGYSYKVGAWLLTREALRLARKMQLLSARWLQAEATHSQ